MNLTHREKTQYLVVVKYTRTYHNIWNLAKHKTPTCDAGQTDRDAQVPGQTDKHLQVPETSCHQRTIQLLQPCHCW